MDTHITVLPRESIDALKLREGSVVVDATANGGGHTARMLEVVGKSGVVVAIDVDPKACAGLRERFSDEVRVGRLKVVEGNFRDISAHLDVLGITEVDGILADLGWSTNQFDAVDDGRGFSFRRDEPLLMTYGNPEGYPFTARDIVNRWTEEDIANVLYGYADERASRKIARIIVEERQKKPIQTSGQLATLIESALGRRGKIHPATKTFQALRIAVNDELGALESFIAGSLTKLKSLGRLAIITFHSIEDRIVKHRFKDAIDTNVATNPIKKHIDPTRTEILDNPRARSAKLRIIERNNEKINLTSTSVT